MSKSSPWWTREGIKQRWDTELDTGPPKVILAKLYREGRVPFAGGLMGFIVVYAGGVLSSVSSTITYQLSLGAFAGVFIFLYWRAGFRNSALRHDE